MSRAWDKAKAGAGWMSKIGAVTGALGGGMYAAASIVLAAGAPIAGGILATIAIGMAVGAAVGAISGAITGMTYGGLYGAVVDEPKAPHVQVVENFRSTGPVVHEPEQAQAPNVNFQNMVTNSRAQAAEAKR